MTGSTYTQTFTPNLEPAIFEVSVLGEPGTIMYHLVNKLLDALIFLLAKRILCASDFCGRQTGTPEVVRRLNIFYLYKQI
jgi:hypothetical protein